MATTTETKEIKPGDGAVSVIAAGDTLNPAGTKPDDPLGSKGDQTQKQDAKPAVPDPTAWFGALPEELRTNPSIKKYEGKSIEDLARGYDSVERLVGAKGVIVPPKDAPPEAWRAFFTATGAPEKPDGYEFPKENVPDIGLDDASKGWWTKVSHDAGLSKTQFAHVFREYSARMDGLLKGQATQLEAMREANVRALRTEWNAAYDQNVRLANILLEKFDEGGKALEVLRNAGLGSHPAIVKMFSKAGRNFAEDEVIGGGKRQGFVPTPKEAERQWHEYTTANGKAYNDASDPNHEPVVREANRLAKLAWPGEEVHGLVTSNA